MDVTNADQAHIAEEAGAVAVMALERVPADIRAQGGSDTGLAAWPPFSVRRGQRVLWAQTLRLPGDIDSLIGASLAGEGPAVDRREFIAAITVNWHLERGRTKST